MSQQRGVESSGGAHVFGQRSGHELEQEAQAAQDAPAYFGGDVRVGDEGDERRRYARKVREEGALEVASEDRKQLEGFVSGLSRKKAVIVL